MPAAKKHTSSVKFSQHWKAVQSILLVGSVHMLKEMQRLVGPISRSRSATFAYHQQDSDPQGTAWRPPHRHQQGPPDTFGIFTHIRSHTISPKLGDIDEVCRHWAPVTRPVHHLALSE